MSNRESATPRYELVKRYILERLETGALKPGDRVPSEHEFTALLGVSRMTVNRALRELTSEGYLERSAGLGTFIAETRAQSHLVEIQNIREEVQGRGHAFKTSILSRERGVDEPEAAKALKLEAGLELVRSRHVHFEAGRPIQLEDRYISEAVFPGYFEADFTDRTPNEYLMKEALVERAEHIVSAVPQTQDLKVLLELEDGEPVLLLERITWAQGMRATYARLYHPGSRYQLRDQFET